MCTTAAQEDPVAGNVAEAAPVPIPPRFRWLKRILVGVALLLVVLAGLRWGWGVLAHRRLQAEIDRIRAAGEPLLPSDFDSAHVPDEKNAALVLEEAMAAATRQGADLVELVCDADRWAENRSAVRKIVVDNARTLALIRKARSLGVVDWNVRIRTPVVNAITTVLADLGDHRDLAKLAYGAAMSAHHLGDDATVIKRVRDMLALARLMEKRPMLTAHLVAIAEETFAARAIETVAPRLSITSVPAPGRLSGRAADQAQIRALVSELLDETDVQASLVQAMYCERMMHAAMLLQVPGGTAAGAAMPSIRHRLEMAVLGPRYELERARGLRHLSQVAQAVHGADWPAVKRGISVADAPSGVLSRVTINLSAILIPSLERGIQLHFQALAQRRMAAIALAIRMYELEHGCRPARLADLVPEYLPSVPADPFAADGTGIRYRPAADPPVLYSVSENGVDENGASGDRWSGYYGKDVPFFLDGDRP